MRLSLPGWVLALSMVGFLATWVAAPRQSLSGRSAPLPPPPAPRPPIGSAVRSLPPMAPAPAPHSLFTLSRPNRVALTFDDGPHHLYTARLLQILAAHRVQATFFVNGCWLDPDYAHSARNREVLARTFAEGHAVGNHTYHHVNLGGVTHSEQTFEIMENERIIERVLGVRPYLFRPPYAVLTRHSLGLLREQDYMVVRWNAAVPGEHQLEPQQIRDSVLLWLRHHAGGIVMLHDRNRATVEATDLILRAIDRENVRRLSRSEPVFRVVPLDSFLEGPAESGPRGGEPPAPEALRNESP